MKNNWNELKDIKAPQELKERTLAAAREARKLTNEPLHAVPRHPWGMAKRLLAAACAFGIVLGGTAVYRTHNGTAQIMVWGSDEMHMYADLCWKLDNGFTDAYDPDTSYGLWLPSQPETTDDDLQDSWHAAVDGFEGAKLTVTITFTDGSEQTRSMTLHTGKLGVEYKDDTSGPSLTGEVLTDEQAAAEGYIYGVYADIE